MHEATEQTSPIDGLAIPALKKFQAMVGTGLFLVLFTVLAATDLCARQQTIAQWLSHRQMDRSIRNNDLYVNVGAYYDLGDKLLLQDLPNADYSKGGVYVLGSSTATYCLDDYRLAPAPARLIHNYGIYGANLTQIDHFIHFMDEQQHFLSAGGGKTMLMIGLTYTESVERGQGWAEYFPNYFSRTGVMSYDDQKGVSPIPMTGLERLIRTEYSRCRSFTLRCLLGPTVTLHVPFDPKHFRELNVERLGNDWPAVLNRQLAALGDLLDHAKSRHVAVVGFMVPEGSWNFGVPAHEAFNKQVAILFKERGLELLDYSSALPDSDFYDYLHCAPSGTAKMQKNLVPVATAFLKQTGALP